MLVVMDLLPGLFVTDEEKNMGKQINHKIIDTGQNNKNCLPYKNE